MKRVLLVLLAVGILMAPLISSAALNMKDKDLLLYLPCNEGKGNVVGDLSANKFDGQIVGTVGWVDGKIGKALEFKEGGEVKCPHVELNNKSFTVCLWTMPKLAGGAEQCVFTQTQANATNTSLHFRIYTTSVIRMGFYSNDLDSPAGKINANEWAHICYWTNISGNSSSRKIYVNGQKVAEDSGKGPYLGTAGDTMIGSWGGSGQKYNGLIDEVQIWNRALSENEVKESMGNIMTISVASSGKLATTWGEVKENR